MINESLQHCPLPNHSAGQCLSEWRNHIGFLVYLTDLPEQKSIAAVRSKLGCPISMFTDIYVGNIMLN